MRFRGESSFVRVKRLFSDFARDCLVPDNSVLQVADCLMRKVHAEFTYAPGETEIATPLLEVFQKRRGVCQDYAHFMIACLRSAGLAARYVSGYLRTQAPAEPDPEPVAMTLIGADASHAWVAVFAPPFGWVEFDPTNNVRGTARSTSRSPGARLRRCLTAARSDPGRRLAHAVGAGRSAADCRCRPPADACRPSRRRSVGPWRQLAERAPGLAAAMRGADRRRWLRARPRVLAVSDFVLDALCARPGALARIDRRGTSRIRRDAVAGCPHQRQARKSPISWRRCGAGAAPSSRASRGATWRGWASLDETLADLSRAADAALQRGRAVCHARARARATASRAVTPARRSS